MRRTIRTQPRIYSTRYRKRDYLTSWRLWQRRIFIPWSRLVRAPNLFTVPGDMLGGAILASVLTQGRLSFWGMFCMSISSVLLYSFGTIFNDLCDLPMDSRLRPERPLPSRQISTRAAALAALGCVVAGIFLALFNGRRPFYVSIVLTMMILAYNLHLKKFLAPGSIAMGLCRGLNFLLGASVVGFSWGVFPAALGLTAHIFMVTWLADGENRLQIPKNNVFFPALAFLVAWLVTLPFIPNNVLRASGGASFCCLLIAVGMNFRAAMGVFNKSTPPAKMRRLIGQLIRTLIFWQAAWIVLIGHRSGLEIIVIMTAFWVMSTSIGHKISGS